MKSSTPPVEPNVVTPAAASVVPDGASAVLRPHAEHEFAHELAALAKVDDRERPPNWKLSPWAVVQYVLGGTLPDGTVLSPKYVGQRRLVEIAVATLATDRALLLLGVPGTAKTWLSEHLTAAISGDSTLLVQGTAGTAEEQLRYAASIGVNKAVLLPIDVSSGSGDWDPQRTAAAITGAVK